MASPSPCPICGNLEDNAAFLLDEYGAPDDHVGESCGEGVTQSAGAFVSSKISKVLDTLAHLHKSADDGFCGPSKRYGLLPSRRYTN